MLELQLTDPAILGLATALGIGLLIGAERERRKGEGPRRAPAGIRTFAIVALLGAVTARVGEASLIAVLLAGVMAFAWMSYRESRAADPGITTEFALVLTALLGVLAMETPALAAGIGVVVAVLLAARGWLHHFVRRALSERELHDFLMLAAAVLVVMPLVPDRVIGPFDAVNPRQLWLIVVVIMSISAAGYVAQKMVGARFGLPLAGFISGFVSSTATIGAMGGLASRTPGLRQAAIAAAVLSTVATIVQMTVLLAVLSRETLLQMAAPLAFAGVAALAYGGLFTRKAMRVTAADGTATDLRAVNLATAVGFAAVVAGVQVVAAGLEAWLGSTGVTAAAAAGFADTHAPAASVASLVAAARLTPAQAVMPILLALTTNTISKSVLAVTAGGRAYGAPVIGGLVLVIAAAWLGTFAA